MVELSVQIKNYLEDCRYIKGLSDKTIKAYTIDLKQFALFSQSSNEWYEKAHLEKYIKNMHISYKPRSAKRKVACIKSFFHYLEIEEIISENAFHKIKVKHKETLYLPKTIPINIITEVLRMAYKEAMCKDKSVLYQKNAIRNVAVIELLFATGIRVNELCTLKKDNIDFKNKIIKVRGKGAKERYIYITNLNVISALKKYYGEFDTEIANTGYFFINNRGAQLSEQSVRLMIQKYEKKAGVNIHLTPHMFRHTFATLLLEEDVDIRYIQELLGHSSITTTQIYTHISTNAQKRLLTRKHPRNKIKIKE